MAIDIEWLPKPPNRNDEEGTPQMFPRIVNSEVVDEDALAKIISTYDTYTRGQVKGILTNFGETVAKLLVEGKTIQLPYLGTFRLTVGTAGIVAPSTPYSARSIEVRGVNFQPAKELMNSISNPRFRTVARNAATIVPSASDLVAPLSKFFESHGSITNSEFAALFKQKCTTAHDRLDELQEMGVIRTVESNRETRYEKGLYNQ